MRDRMAAAYRACMTDLTAPASSAELTPGRPADVSVASGGEGPGSPTAGPIDPRVTWLRRLFWLMLAGVLLGAPLALKAGSEVFLPVTAAVVIAIALVPTLEWLERRGVRSGLAAGLCVLLFLVVLVVALSTVVVPAADWVAALPERLPRVQATLGPILDLYSNLEKYVNDALARTVSATNVQAQAVAIQSDGSAFGTILSSAPAALVQTFFALLLIFFFLAGWTGLRRTTISSRASFDSALNTARIIQNVVDATSAYLTTIVFINVALGLTNALILWAIGMPSPLMWGGIVTICNFVPYVGPIIAAGLLALGGLMSFDSVWLALTPAIVAIVLHFIEANLVTPYILGRRLTINPVLILLSLSFWGWVWGAPGALLAVPILIVLQTIRASLRPPALPAPTPLPPS